MTKILYNSTRNNQQHVSAAQAIIEGIALDGGLYMPTEMPQFTFDWQAMSKWRYQAVATYILQGFFPDFTREEIEYCVNQAYDDKFDDERIAPLVEVEPQTYVLELFHGSTIAFKDMALSILPYLMTTAAKKLGITDELVILTATSGDTGKAALAGFCGVSNTKMIVFYPETGVSPIQKLQMVTQKGNNTKVVAVKGNFDDAQSQVKAIFNDEVLRAQLLEHNIRLSSANSINIGRLMPQVAYYVYAYAQLIQQGAITPNEQINIAVPTGNFGNILAAYFAKMIGVPIKQLICASNENNVLVDFFKSGQYNRNRQFVVTNSPSMDILVSSNLERLLYLLSNRNDQLVQSWANDLSAVGQYEVTADVFGQLNEFVAGECSQANTVTTIKDVFNRTNYTLDPHTAVAYYVNQHFTPKESVPTVIAGTASPYKFAETVLTAIGQADVTQNNQQMIAQLHQLTQLAIPQAVSELFELPIRHRDCIEVAEMANYVKKYLSVM